MEEGREPSLHRILLVPVEVGWEGPRTLCSSSAYLPRPRTKATGRAGEVPGCAQRASSNRAGEEACDAGVDWSCVNPVLRILSGKTAK